jgi:hypothetical protein
VECIPDFIEEVYNRKRVHSGIQYLPPEEFEAILQDEKKKQLLGQVTQNCPVKSPVHRVQSNSLKFKCSQLLFYKNVLKLLPVKNLMKQTMAING